MSGFTDVKRNKILSALRWLENQRDVRCKEGSKHLKVECLHNNKVFMIPSRHREVNKHIVKAFVEWLKANNVRGADEFGERL